MKKNQRTNWRNCLISIGMALLLAVIPSRALTQIQQITIEGVISLHNSQFRTGTIEYIKDAFVSAPFATPVVTDVEGRFRLQFVGMPTGASVRIRVEKAGFEVINERELENVVLGRKTPLRIVMAPEGTLAENKLQYYQISLKALKESYDQKIEREKNLTTNIDSLNEVLKNLQDEYQKAKQQANALAEQFARINLDEQSKSYTEALNAFEKGDIQRAIYILEKDDLFTKVNQTNKTVQEAKADLQMALQSYILKAEAYKLLYDYDNAEQSFLKAFAIDSLDLEVLTGLADLYTETLDAERAIEYYNKALASANEALPQASLLDKIGRQYLVINELGKADSSFIKARSLLEPIYSKAPSTIPVKNQFGQLSSSLGRLYLLRQKFDQAEQYFMDAFEIFKDLSAEDPQSFRSYLANSYHNLSGLYRSLGQNDKALEFSEEALALHRKQTAEAPRTFEADQAVTLRNLGFIYFDLGAYEKGTKALSEVLDIYEKLSDTNPDAFLPAVGQSLLDLSSSYMTMAKYDSTEILLDRALSIFRRLETSNPMGYQPEIARSLMNLGVLYYYVSDLSASVSNLQYAIAIYERLNQDDVSYANQLNYAKGALANVSYTLGEYQKAIDLYQDLLPTVEANSPVRSSVLYNLANTYYSVGKYAQAEKYYTESLDLLLEAFGPNHPQTANTYAGLASVKAAKGEIAQAEENYLKALAIFKASLGSTSSNVAILMGNLGALYLTNEQYDKAEKILQEGLKIAKDVLPEKHPLFGHFMANLGRVYTKKAQFQEAEASYLFALEILEKSDLTLDQAKVYQDLGLLYREMNLDEKADEFLARASDTYERLGIENPVREFTPQPKEEAPDIPITADFSRPDSRSGRNTSSNAPTKTRLTQEEAEAIIAGQQEAEDLIEDVSNIKTRLEQQEEQLEQAKEALLLKARFQKLEEDFHKSISSYEDLLQIDSLNVQVYDEYVNLTMRMREFEKMKEATIKFMRLAVTRRDTAYATLFRSQYFEGIGSEIESIQGYESSLKQFRKERDTIQVIKVLKELAPLCAKLNLFSTSIDYYRELLGFVAQDETEKDYRVEIFLNLGDLYAQREALDNSRICYREALKFLEIYKQETDEKYYNTKAEIYRHLGGVFLKIDSLPQAINAFRTTIQINDSLMQNAALIFQYQERLALAYSQTGEAFRQSNDLEKAVQHFKKAKTLFESLNYVDIPKARNLIRLYQLGVTQQNATIATTTRVSGPNHLVRAISILEKYPEDLQAHELLKLANEIREQEDR